MENTIQDSGFELAFQGKMLFCVTLKLHQTWEKAVMTQMRLTEVGPTK